MDRPRHTGKAAHKAANPPMRSESDQRTQIERGKLRRTPP